MENNEKITKWLEIDHIEKELNDMEEELEGADEDDLLRRLIEEAMVIGEKAKTVLVYEATDSGVN